MATSPQVFNELLLKTSGLAKLTVNQIIGDSSTKQDIKQRLKLQKNVLIFEILFFRIEKLTTSINEPIPKPIDFVKDKQTLVKQIFFLNKIFYF